MLLIFLGALAIGASLGLLGSGGSILTVPVLIYILQRPDKLAIAESLAIVGGIALAGATPYVLRGWVHWKSVLCFGLTGMAGAALGAFAARFVTSPVQLSLFACTMLVATWVMLWGPPIPSPETTRSSRMIILDGFIVGCLTGFLGIGGGFLIVPALVLFGKLSMHLAIGTSLVIIAMNAFTGFLGQWIEFHHLHLQVSWKVILLVAAVGTLGSLAGSLFGSKLDQSQLKRIFALFIFIVAMLLLLREIHSSQL